MKIGASGKLLEKKAYMIFGFEGWMERGLWSSEGLFILHMFTHPNNRVKESQSFGSYKENSLEVYNPTLVPRGYLYKDIVHR